MYIQCQRIQPVRSTPDLYIDVSGLEASGWAAARLADARTCGQHLRNKNNLQLGSVDLKHGDFM